MDHDTLSRPEVTPRRRSPARAIFGVAMGSFLLGGAVVWFLAGTPGLPDGSGFPLQRSAATPSPSPQPTLAPDASAGIAAEAHQAVQQVAQVAQQQGGLDQRVAAMEQRLARLDLQAQAAEGNAARAEGLLIAFATRRALERGSPLGYLEDQLKLRFGGAQPKAVQAIVDVAKDPVTLDQLLVRLSGLSPTITRRPQGESPLAWISREFSQLFVVRRQDAPSSAAVDRVERARLFLRTGRADRAAEEVRRLPNAAVAADWVADAERYAAAQRALDLIETAAISEPRTLRDSSGQQVRQPSPVG